MLKLTQKSSGKQSGQMAIFIAIIFQVLFVFFAMVINVGLLVHHKINLQNAVDLAAYYGASRQAEMLNAVAHVNYQIRQTWKLLAWRYWVLGSMASIKHPARAKDLSPQEKAWEELPQVCVIDGRLFTESPINNTTCLKVHLQNYSIPNLVIPKVSASFLPFNQTIKKFTESLQEQNVNLIQLYGGANWQFAYRIYNAYRLGIDRHKKVIKALAESMSATQNEFYDIKGNKVSEAMRKTFEKNLTQPNAASIQEFKILNSLAVDNQCANGAWISDIQVFPDLIYTDYVREGGASPKPKSFREQPEYYDVVKGTIDPDGNFLKSLVSEPMNPSIGYEKNPWCIAYVGVKATVSPKIPFAPMDQGVTITAKAFAKPFGGRIGPWYTSQWPLGSSRSTGGQVLDALVPPRNNENGQPTSAEDRLAFIPNYSRFVGDTLGLKSIQALSAYGKPLNEQRQQWKYWQGGEQLNKGDILAWDWDNDKAPKIRDYELAAISPDEFDVTYYSVDANFSANYYEGLKTLLKQVSLDPATLLIPDLGYRSGSVDKMSVKIQIEKMASLLNEDLKGAVFWTVQSPDHLLTAWSQISTRQYDFDTVNNTNYFGQCHKYVDEGMPPVPGMCLAGGRLGYSTKIVSYSMLNSEMALGGGDAVGKPLNSPDKSDLFAK